MKIVLCCPECGSDVFRTTDNEGYFECAACGEFSLTEEMTAKVVPDGEEDCGSESATLCSAIRPTRGS